MTRQVASPAGGVWYAVIFDSPLAAKNFLLSTVMASVLLLVVASNMVAILGKGLALGMLGCRRIYSRWGFLTFFLSMS